MIREFLDLMPTNDWFDFLSLVGVLVLLLAVLVVTVRWARGDEIGKAWARRELLLSGFGLLAIAGANLLVYMSFRLDDEKSYEFPWYIYGVGFIVAIIAPIRSVLRASEFEKQEILEEKKFNEDVDLIRSGQKLGGSETFDIALLKSHWFKPKRKPARLEVDFAAGVLTIHTQDSPAIVMHRSQIRKVAQSIQEPHVIIFKLEGASKQMIDFATQGTLTGSRATAEEIKNHKRFTEYWEATGQQSAA